VLPWVELDEISVAEVEEERVLLVRGRPQPRYSGDLPGWWDRAYLRSVARDAGWARAYHLAVPLADFTGTTEELLAELAPWAPAHIALVDRT
jgi:hypothetical protein